MGTPKKGATTVEAPKKEVKPLNGTANNQEIAKQKISELINPSAKARISRLETFKVIAEKHEAMTSKYDELTRFMASNDGTNANMKFNSDNGYSFTLKNPAVISKVLLIVEKEFSNVLEATENEVLSFTI